MIKLLCVGDGERDHATVPHLIGTLLQKSIQLETRPWARLSAPRGPTRGYARKLAFARLVAEDHGCAGLVAVIDRDKDRDGERLKDLRAGRYAQRRTAPPFPTALGQAIPHGEAWLLDDPIAVRQALQLAPACPVPNVRECRYPKSDLEQLWTQSPLGGRGALEAWELIAKLVQRSRCAHRKETGFEKFAQDVHDELGQL
jgi:hypothetical protein